VANRKLWTDLTDAQLLAQCEVDTYRASGPGGQKRNKTSSAVRLRHEPSRIIVIAEESRSQHENKAKAVKRLRQALFLKIREPLVHDQFDTLALRDELTAAKDRTGRLDVGRRDQRFWPAVGLVLDALERVEARIADGAKLLGVTTGNLIDFLQIEQKVWEQTNQMRLRFGRKKLQMDR
jgi:hypothetical protein